jgi:hypothetical protein
MARIPRNGLEEVCMAVIHAQDGIPLHDGVAIAEHRGDLESILGARKAEDPARGFPHGHRRRAVLEEMEEPRFCAGIIEALERGGDLVALVLGEIRFGEAGEEDEREGAVLVLANLLVRDCSAHDVSSFASAFSS